MPVDALAGSRLLGLNRLYLHRLKTLRFDNHGVKLLANTTISCFA